MRKLSRQATIFALLGFLLTFISFFAILGANITTNAMADATAAVHAEIDPPGIHLPLGSTRSQAETALKKCYFDGGAKAWRHAAGRWASLYKNLCLMEGKGVYGDWLKRHDVNRSSMDDLIRRFENEATWAAQELVLPESGKTDQGNQAPIAAVSVFSLRCGPEVNERTSDPQNDERQKNIQAEISKRDGIKPSHHKTILYVQRRGLDPEILALYNTIKGADRKRVDAIMRRKLDEGIEEVLVRNNEETFG
jgi:hypothetical protein